MPLKKTIVAASLFFLCATTYGQDTTFNLKTRKDSINALLKALRSWGYFEPQYVGAFGTPSFQYCRFAFLIELCTEAELVELTSDSSACVRVYAFAGLAYRKYSEEKSIRKILANDSCNINTVQGCVEGSTTVGQLITHNNMKGFYAGRQRTALLKLLFDHQENPAVKAAWKIVLEPIKKGITNL